MQRQIADSFALSVKEACESISIGRTSFYKYVKLKIIPAHKIGSRTIVLVDELPQRSRIFLAQGGVMSKNKRKAPTNHETAPESPSGRFWTLSIEPAQTAYIADNVWLYVVIQNRGLGMIGVSIRRDGDLMKILPGGLRAMPVSNALSVENMSNKPALVKIEFLPRSK